MTPTLDQCRALELLYPKQWEHSKQMWVVPFGAGDDQAYVIDATDWLHHTLHKTAQFLCAAPSYDELIEKSLSQGDKIWCGRRTQMEITYGLAPYYLAFHRDGDDPEVPVDCVNGNNLAECLAAALIAAGGGESQHRESPEGGG